jgi:hypothetical protein
MIRIITSTISLQELKELAKNGLGSLVKAVVDIERKIMAIDGAMHADEEQTLLNDGSKQQDLWGINIYPDNPIVDRFEFDSMINIRPSQGNPSRSVENFNIQKEIQRIVNTMIID